MTVHRCEKCGLRKIKTMREYRLSIIIACISAALFSLFCANTPAASDPLTVRVGAYENSPKIFTGTSGEYIGIFPDLLDVIAEKEGWKIEFVPGSWTQCLERLENGEIDLMVDVAYSEAREKKYDFNSESIFINWGLIYTRKGLAIESFLDLRNKKIAVMKGSIHTVGKGGIKKLLQNFNIPCEFIEVGSYKDVFRLLDSGAADAGAVNRLFGSLFEQEYMVAKSTLIFNPRHLKFAFPKNTPLSSHLIKRIDTHLNALKKEPNSVFFKIIDNYLWGIAFKRTHGEESAALILTPEEKAWIQTHPVVRFGVDPEFMPFEYFDEKGNYSGIASDYIKILNRIPGLNLRIVPGLSWRQAVDKAQRGELDILPCIGVTEERREFLNFSRPYIEFHRVIITRSDTPFLSDLDDLRDMTVAVQSNTSHEGFLQDQTDITPLLFPTLQETLRAVSDGKADALIGNIASATYWIRKLNLTNLKVAAPASQEVQRLYFGVRRDWPELVQIINKALAAVSPEETRKIQQRWVEVEYDPGIEPAVFRKYVERIVLVSFLVLTGFFLWNFSLKKEITKRKKAEEKLQYSNRFERLILEMSSRFIGLKPEEVDRHIEEALAEIVSFTDTDAGYLFEIDQKGKTISCSHLWHGENLEVDIQAWQKIGFEHNSPWMIRLQEGRVITEPAMQSPSKQVSMEREYLRAQGILSVVDVPRSCRGEVIGFLGISTARPERTWSDDEISLLTLVGLIFTNALLRKEADLALLNYAERLEKNKGELEASKQELETKTVKLQKSQRALTYLLEDVNEAKAELEAANEKLKALDRLKSMFIASMSHELRTPLNSIIGFTGIILQGLAGEINEEQKDQLQRVYGAARHLLALITDVIDISKIEAGRLDVYAEEFNLGGVVKEAVSSISTQLKDKGLELAVKIPKELQLKTDRRRLLQCILNYLSNAVRYTEKGEISLVAVETNGTLEVRVTDTGIGIREEDLPILFTSFARLDSPLRTKTPGTGLGLYLTKKIVSEMLGGSVSVESEYGTGSTFIFQIPVTYQKEEVTQ